MANFREYQKRVRARVTNDAKAEAKSASVNWQSVIDALNNERERIRTAARSKEHRIPLKEKVIEEYLSYTHDPKAPSVILSTLMLWSYDCRLIGQAFELSKLAIERKAQTPEWCKRESIAELIADEIYDWADEAHKKGVSSAPYLDDAMVMLEGHDIPDALKANLCKLKALTVLGEYGVKINTILDKDALQKAEQWLVKSAELGGSVKTNLTAVRKRIDKL